MGQWVEIEAAEAMSNRSDLSAMNSSGIMLSSVANKQNELHGDLPSENNGKAGLDARTGTLLVVMNDCTNKRCHLIHLFQCCQGTH